ncbi:methyltransferase domain protein [Bacteriovorax sp. BSW11_IV]|uniref:methyltransferase n=1 Tax=Bacteriovorax sp. BSW11_IV TaxID=1353529 RepID=UPI00038A224C|nr:methyltransferase [Bacteriovorax sp. BSW11_IV]EQC47857.1 methyltransferase domain protein [Bacteriovorax sp. BSW11_IV]
MNYRDRFIKISNFLRPLAPLWQDEILNTYPDSLQHYPQSWIDTLCALNEDELYQVDIKDNFESITKTELGQWLNQIKALCQIERIELSSHSPKEALPPYAFHKVKAKKQYEIKIIGDFIEALDEQRRPQKLIDIGGGVGHLARIMAHYYNLETTSIDCNEEFQQIGRERLKKYPAPKGAKTLSYINLLFGPEGDDNQLRPLFDDKTLSLGLHTCGPLALAHFRTNFKYQTKSLINFGCCYSRMSASRDVNVSHFAKENPLEFNEYTLALASRGHNSMTMQDFKLKRQVKNYRYTLHFFLKKYFPEKTFLSVGEVLTKEYRYPFSQYAKGRMDHLGIDSSAFSDEELDSFYSDSERQKELDQIFVANVIRWQLGRICELYILLDRCLYLEENDHDVVMKEFFSDDISPRNIGIYANKRLP